MRILLAATSGENFSGASKCLIELAENLKRRDFDVIVILPRKGLLEDSLKNIGIKYYVIHEYQCWYSDLEKGRWINTKRVLNYLAILKVKKILVEEKIDIVHVNACTAYVVGKAAILSDVKLVWHIREFMEEDLNISFVDKKYSMKILNNANYFIAISKPIFDKWKKNIEVPMKVIHDGVPIENYYIEKKEKRNQITILLYGRIVEGKGQLFYIKGAIEALKKIKVKCEFIFAGTIEDKVYYEECCKVIRDNGMEHIIRYTGNIVNVKELLYNTDVVCVCSKMEGFGRVTVEAMLGKCLVLGANTGATSELIIPGKTGVIYQADNLKDFSEKMVSIVNQHEMYEQIKISGQEYAMKNFSVNVNTEKIIRIYEELGV